MSLDFSKLNKNQITAVMAGEGPYYVVAGAGTGKTTVLTSRIQHLIETNAASPYEILALTFTKKAANEMLSRLKEHLDFDANYMWVSTFHSFCCKILRREIENFSTGRTRGFEIIDESDQKALIRRINKDQELGIETEVLKIMQNMISNFKSGIKVSVPPSDLGNFQSLYAAYEDELVKLNSFDFDDLLVYTKKLFTEKPEIAKKYQDKFKYILVDEFQDTSKLQFDLLIPIVNSKNNIFVVGDPDQSIYAFRGADYSNSNKFLKRLPDVTTLILDLNYRSHQNILDIANSLIKKNEARLVSKDLISAVNVDCSTNIIEFNSAGEEAYGIMNKIESYVNKGYNYSDCAILYRAGYVSLEFEQILKRRRIPYKIYGGFKFLERLEIKNCLAVLSLAINPNNYLSFKRVVGFFCNGVGDKTIEKIISYSVANSVDLFSAIEPSGLSSKQKTELERVKLEFEILSEMITANEVKDIINYITEHFNVIESTESAEELEVRTENMHNFNRMINNRVTDTVDEEGKVPFIEIVNEIFLESIEKNANEGDAVILSTIHQVKGLEFKNVFIVALEMGIFPRSRYSDEIEEERRVLYVAITRAMENIILSYSKSRYVFGKSNRQEPSPFIMELKNASEMDLIEDDYYSR